MKLAAPAVRQQPSEASGCGGAPAECLGVSPAGCLSGSISEVEGGREGSGEEGRGEGGLEE